MFGFIRTAFKIILILLGVAFLAGYWLGSAHGEEYTISLSDSCIALLKINDTTCPSYAEIIQVFPDQSDQKISGKFGYKDGYYQRLSSPYKNFQYGYYKYLNGTRLWIDAPSDVKPAKNIVIAPRNFEYIIHKQIIDTTKNNTLMVGQNRYVSKTCSYAIITSENWLFLLGDTLKYLQTGCHDTNFDEKKIVSWTRNYHDITTSAKYKLEQWVKQSIDKCSKTVCIPK